ncbi:TetR/AcrR family transcriptional regulator [Hyphobacterium sp.]|uniref:TetR/AcrR family transcriptional regulator n=1 Tax=Hyphobacterium sp. TaxID=2004662 RepID=UPI0037486863
MNVNIGRSSARGAAKTKYLIDVATRLFVEFGYGRMGLDVLVRDAKVSKTTVYSRFSSKTELFKAVIQDACAEAGSRTPDAIPDLDDLPGTLTMVGHDVLARFSLPTMQAILFGIAEASRTDPTTSRLFWDAGPGRGARIIAESIDRKNPSAPAFELGNQFVLDISGVIVGRSLLGFDDFSKLDFDAIVDEHVATFLARNKSLLSKAAR